MLSLVLGEEFSRGNAQDQRARDPADQLVQRHTAAQVAGRARPAAIPLHGSATQREHDELDVSAVDIGRARQHGRPDRPGPTNGRVSARSGAQQTGHCRQSNGLRRRALDHRLDVVRAVDILSTQGPRRGGHSQTREVPGARVGPLDAAPLVPAVEAQRLLGQLVLRSLHTPEGDEEGARDSPTAQGHHGLARAQGGQLRHRLGHCPQVHLFGILSSCGAPQGHRRVRQLAHRHAVSFASHERLVRHGHDARLHCLS